MIEKDGAEYQCFGTEDWRTLAHLITDYHSLWFQAQRFQRELRLASDQSELWRERIDLWKDVSEVQKQDRLYLRTMFEEEHKVRLNIQKTSEAKSWVMWAVIVVESVALGVLGVVHGATR